MKLSERHLWVLAGTIFVVAVIVIANNSSDPAPPPPQPTPE
jgi:hypothetical protein